MPWASTSSRPDSPSRPRATSSPSTKLRSAPGTPWCAVSPAPARRTSTAPARRGRIHTFISTSPVHMKWKLQMEAEQVYGLVVSSVTRARNYTDDVEWSSEDGTRTEHDFLCRCVEAAIKAGATTINIPDTVGYTVPDEYFALFQNL